MEKSDFIGVKVKKKRFSKKDMINAFKAGYYRSVYEQRTNNYEPDFKEWMKEIFS